MHETRTVQLPTLALDPASLYQHAYDSLQSVTHYLCVPVTSLTDHPKSYSLDQVVAANKARAMKEIDQLLTQDRLKNAFFYFPHFLGVRTVGDRKWGEYEYTLFSVMVLSGLIPDDAQQLQHQILLEQSQRQTINNYDENPESRWNGYLGFADSILSVIASMSRTPKTLVPLAFADQSFGGRLEMYLADKLDIPRLR